MRGEFVPGESRRGAASRQESSAGGKVASVKHAGPSMAEILGGLKRAIRPVEVSESYSTYLAAVGMAMFLLPINMLMIAGLIVWGSWRIVDSTSSLWLTFVVVFVSAVLLAFLLRPMLVFFRRQTEGYQELDAAREPDFVRYIKAVCQVTGAPEPDRILIDMAPNAAAGRRTWLFGLIRGKRELIVGLPLVRSLDLRQFTGVMAHELGHFAQNRAGVLNQNVEMINVWLSHAVYGDGRLDRWFHPMAPGRSVYGRIWRFLLVWMWVWLLRRVLLVLLFAGAGMSRALIREREFDADLYETRVAGTGAFIRTAEDLSMISVVTQEVYEELPSLWEKKRLPDDIIELIHSSFAGMSDEQRVINLKLTVERERTRRYDTHPSTRERIQAARAADEVGVFDVEGSATALFSDFGALSRDVTQRFYEAVVGKSFRRDAMISSAEVIGEQMASREASKVYQRYMYDCVEWARPIWPVSMKAFGPPRDVKKLVDELLFAHERQRLTAPRARSAMLRYNTALGRVGDCRNAFVLQRLGAEQDVRTLPFVEAGETLGTAEMAARQQQDEAEAFLKEFELSAKVRLNRALRLYRHPAIHWRIDGFVPADVLSLWGRMFETLRGMEGGDAPAKELLERYQQFAFLAELSASLETLPEPVAAAMREEYGHTLKALGRLVGSLRGVTWPFADGQGQTLSDKLVGSPPPHRDVAKLRELVEKTLTGYFDLYHRIMTELTQCAEAVEAAIGIPVVEDDAGDVLSRIDAAIEAAEVGSGSSNPGILPLSLTRMKVLEPTMVGFTAKLLIPGWFLYRWWVRRFMRIYLNGGDARAALVVSLDPLLVATYTDELDAVALYRFPTSLVNDHGLSLGDRLVCVSAFQGLPEGQADLEPGDRHTGRWSCVYFLVGEFLSDDEARLATLHSRIEEDEWERVEVLAAAWLKTKGPVARDGTPSATIRPNNVAGVR